MNDTMASIARGIIRDAVMESRFKGRRGKTYNEIAIKCREQMRKHFNGNWNCHIATVGQLGSNFFAKTGTTFRAEIDGLFVRLYKPL